MSWFNYIGLIIIIVIMILNVIYMNKHKNPEDKNIAKYIVIIENIGRYGSMIFLVFNIPYTWLNFFLPYGLYFYIIVNSILVILYAFLFLLFWNKSGLIKSIFLSIIPSIIFLFSGIMILSIPLIIMSLLFAFGHIYISIKNNY